MHAKCSKSGIRAYIYYGARKATCSILELVQKEGNRMVHDERVYHLGASIKDLGKKWFAFNRMEMTTAELLQKI